MKRFVSPWWFSIAITSAPRSARIWVASGPMMTAVRSSTRHPASGPLDEGGAAGCSGMAVQDLTPRAGACSGDLSTERPSVTAGRRTDDPLELVPQGGSAHPAPLGDDVHREVGRLQEALGQQDPLPQHPAVGGRTGRVSEPPGER